jgi:hypothetical protein
MMRTVLRTSLVVAILLAAGLAGAGDPKTALGKWMQGNMGTPFSADTTDFATLQASYALLISKEPPGDKYAKWDGFLQQGLTAAKANDKPGVKASCKGCHDTHKEDYKKDPNAPKTFP